MTDNSPYVDYIRDVSTQDILPTADLKSPPSVLKKAHDSDRPKNKIYLSISTIEKLKIPVFTLHFCSISATHPSRKICGQIVCNGPWGPQNG